jgi:crotonobetainyl-CoA:carnitine CoA-transferase CaiB-like acyl-CoA transferase
MSGLPDRWPVGWGYSYLDVMSPWFVIAAILMSLRHRGRTGRGQHVDLSQSGPGFLLTGTALLDHQANGRAYRRTGNASPHLPAAPHNVYRCRPGDNGVEEWVVIACFRDEEWQGLVAAMGNPAWAAESQFADLTERLRHVEALDQHIGEWTASWERYALMDHLQRHGVPAGVCQTPADRVDRDPQLAHRDFFVELNHSEVGPHRVENVPGKMSATPPHVGGLHDRGAPCYGEDNEYVFGELLGLPAPEVEALSSARATQPV